MGHLARLQPIRELLTRAGQQGGETAELLLFGSAEPSPELRAAAANGHVRVIGLSDLFA